MKNTISESGISQWTNLSERKYIFYMAMGKCSFAKHKPPTSMTNKIRCLSFIF